MRNIICSDGTEIIEIGNFEIEGFDLIWTSKFIESYGGGYDRVFYNPSFSNMDFNRVLWNLRPISSELYPMANAYNSVI